MGLFDKIKEAVVNVVVDVVHSTVLPTKVLVDVVRGKELDDAVRTAAGDLVAPAVSLAESVALLDGIRVSVTNLIASEQLGPDAAAILADIDRLSRPLSPDLIATVAGGIEEFLRSGDLSYLNPAAILLATELTRCRNTLLAQARSVPNSVKAALHPDVALYCDQVLVVSRSDVPGDINLPTIAIKHLKRATAVCLIDIIVFDQIPGTASDDEKHYWVHELCHAKQFKDWGLSEFCKRYIAEEMGPRPLGWVANSIEIDADRFACDYYPEGSPSYIKSCAVPDQPKKSQRSRQRVNDRNQVAAGQSYEVNYFARKHGITRDHARDLIKRVGNNRIELNAAASRLKAKGQRPRK